jgi:hypothetical protein
MKLQWPPTVLLQALWLLVDYPSDSQIVSLLTMVRVGPNSFFKRLTYAEQWSAGQGTAEYM